MYYEDKYQNALTELNIFHFNIREWLINNFELYKRTLIWPENLPPINRCNLIMGSLRERFNSTYRETLSEFEYEFDNEKQTLKIQ